MAYYASCLCNQVRFRVEQFEPRMAHCHCSMCQKFHGAAFSTLGEVKLENLTWLSGQEQLSQYRANNNTIRQFCRNCGASVSFSSKYNRQDNTIEVAIALIDQVDGDSPALVPDVHIYTASKANWLTIADGLPQCLNYRTDS